VSPEQNNCRGPFDNRPFKQLFAFAAGEGAAIAAFT
jgi:hypothetical protein